MALCPALIRGSSRGQQHGCTRHSWKERPVGGRALDVDVSKDSRDLGTKTEALLASDVSIVEIDELRPLILEGQERGFLTFEQITSCLEEVEVTKEQVLELHAYLEDQGIDVVNAEDGRPAVAEGGRFEPARRRASCPTHRASRRST